MKKKTKSRKMVVFINGKQITAKEYKVFKADLSKIGVVDLEAKQKGK